MNIIITGITGFVGKNLSEYFNSKKYTVQGISLRDVWSLPKHGDAVIHLAGKAHDTENISSDEDYFSVNTNLTIKLFDAFLTSNIRDFIYFSSVKAVADTVSGVLTEDTVPDPKTPYGKSKLKAEQYLLSKKLPEKKRLFIIRPCMIHGPGNKGNLNLLYKIVNKGIPWPLAGFENKRSFLGIDNLNYLVDHLISNDFVSSGIYNFADDGSLSTNDLVKIISEVCNKKTKLMKISPKFILHLAKLGDYFNLPLNSERLKKLTENYEVSNQKIKTQLEINNLPFSLYEGLSKTIKNFQI